MNSTNFDILVVCFNDDSRLLLTLESISDTTFRNLVIIQDGSMLDSTVEVVKKKSDRLNIIHVRERDSGLYDAMNKGARHVNESFFLTINCGDKLLKSEFPYNGDGCNLILCAVSLRFRSRLNLVYRPEILEMHSRMACCHQGAIIEKKLFIDLGGYNIRYKIASDYDFMIRAIKNSNKIMIAGEFIIAEFEGDNGMSEKHRFLLEMETAAIKNTHYSKRLLNKALVIINHILRYINFRLAR